MNRKNFVIGKNRFTLWSQWYELGLHTDFLGLTVFTCKMRLPMALAIYWLLINEDQYSFFFSYPIICWENFTEKASLIKFVLKCLGKFSIILVVKSDEVWCRSFNPRTAKIKSHPQWHQPESEAPGEAPLTLHHYSSP